MNQNIIEDLIINRETGWVTIVIDGESGRQSISCESPLVLLTQIIHSQTPIILPLTRWQDLFWLLNLLRLAGIVPTSASFSDDGKETLIDPMDASSHVLDLMWKKIILARKPNYGDWAYPGEAYRHLMAEIDQMVEEARNHGQS